MEKVWDHADVSGATLLTFLALADSARTESGLAWPGIPYLSRKTRLSERSVQRALTELKDRGYISIERRPNRSSVYRIQFARLRGDKMSSPTKSGPAKLSPLEGTQCHPEPLVEPLQEIYLFDGSSNLIGGRDQERLKNITVNLASKMKIN